MYKTLIMGTGTTRLSIQPPLGGTCGILCCGCEQYHKRERMKRRMKLLFFEL